LYRQLKATAALRGQKVRELVEAGVRMALESPEGPKRKRRTGLPLIRSSRKQPLKIPDDIASKAELADELERHAASLRQ
jgi:hypothetical protein